jgi:RNA polymerase sigma-70 factor (ECF subfamily)
MWMKDEDKLIEEVLQGNDFSFELLLQPYRQGFLTMAYRVTGNVEEAREVCQDAFLKIFRYLRSYKKGRSFKTWAYKIVMNTSFDFLREKKKFEKVIEMQKKSFVFENSDAEKRILNREIREKIQNVLHVLTPKEKAVFLLRDGEGLSVWEASKVLGCSQISIRTHLSRARQKIRDHFEKKNLFGSREVKT